MGARHCHQFGSQGRYPEKGFTAYAPSFFRDSPARRRREREGNPVPPRPQESQNDCDIHAHRQELREPGKESARFALRKEGGNGQWLISRIFSEQYNRNWIPFRRTSERRSEQSRIVAPNLSAETPSHAKRAGMPRCTTILAETGIVPSVRISVV
jgi:hypothetical protein